MSKFASLAQKADPALEADMAPPPTRSASQTVGDDDGEGASVESSIDNQDPRLYQLAGIVQRVQHHSSESGFTIVRVRPELPKQPGKPDMDKADVVVKGTMRSSIPEVGDRITVRGKYEVHPDFGRQLLADSIYAAPLATEQSLFNWIARSPASRGGPQVAEALKEHFGERIAEALADPLVLSEAGIPDSTAERLSREWNNASTGPMALVIEWLRSIGDRMTEMKRGRLTTRQVDNIAAQYGRRTRDVMSVNPWSAAIDVDGVGFPTANAFADAVGIAITAPERLRAAVQFALHSAEGQGHAGLPPEMLISDVIRLLAEQAQDKMAAERVISDDYVPEDAPDMTDRPTVTQDMVLQAVVDLVKAEHVTYNTQFKPSLICRAAISRMEIELADWFARIAAHPIETIISEEEREALIDQATAEWASAREAMEATQADGFQAAGFNLDDSQRDAIRMGLRHQSLIIRGGPGTGKSTIMGVLLTALKLRDPHGFNRSVAKLAPTGRAAKRLTETTRMVGGGAANTIHSALAQLLDEVDRTMAARVEIDLKKSLGQEDDPDVDQDEDAEERSNHLPDGTVLLEESSMGDLPILHSLYVRSVDRDNSRVILIGDPDQLDPVGVGRIFTDLCNSGQVPVATLTTTHRQGAGSAIKVAAAAINAGKMPVSEGDFQIVEEDDAREVTERIVRFVTQEVLVERPGIDRIKDVQILAPTYRGSCGIDEINHQLKEVLNPVRPGDRYITTERRENVYGGHYDVRLSIGDKVINLKNEKMKTAQDQEIRVVNGDIGYIKDFIYPLIADPKRPSGPRIPDRRPDAPIRGVIVDIDGKEVLYPKDKLKLIRHAYCISVHKSQGGEAPVVAIALHDSHTRTMLKRNLFYTAVTRAKSLCKVFGNEKAIRTAVTTVSTDKRFTHFLPLLQKRAQEISLEPVPVRVKRVEAEAPAPSGRRLTSAESDFCTKAMQNALILVANVVCEPAGGRAQAIEKVITAARHFGSLEGARGSTLLEPLVATEARDFTQDYLRTDAGRELLEREWVAGDAQAAMVLSNIALQGFQAALVASRLMEEQRAPEPVKADPKEGHHPQSTPLYKILDALRDPESPSAAPGVHLASAPVEAPIAEPPRRVIGGRIGGRIGSRVTPSTEKVEAPPPPRVEIPPVPAVPPASVPAAGTAPTQQVLTRRRIGQRIAP